MVPGNLIDRKKNSKYVASYIFLIFFLGIRRTPVECLIVRVNDKTFIVFIRTLIGHNGQFRRFRGARAVDLFVSGLIIIQKRHTPVHAAHVSTTALH